MVNKHARTRASRLLAALCILSSGALPAWTGDSDINTAICTVAGDQLYPSATGDNAGGAIIVWEDRRSDTGDIYAQRIDTDGRARWQVGGIPITAAAGQQSSPAIVGDTLGGAYIAWEDYTDSEIHLQHIDANGTAVTGWPAGGLAVTSNAESDAWPRLIPDGLGGVVIAWGHYDAATNWDIHAQRIDGDGSVHAGWPAGGTMVSSASNGQTNPALTGDGNGGAIIVWQSGAVDDKAFAQWIDGSGTRRWDAGGGDLNGIALATSGESQVYPEVAGDGTGGAIVVWQDWRSSNDYGDLYGQRIAADGTLQWGAAGLPLVAVTGSYQDDHRVLSDGHGGAFLAWRDSRNAELWPASPTHYDIYLQRIDGNGADAAGWPANGMRLSAADRRATDPSLVDDGNQGVVVSWGDNVYPTTEVLAQRVSAAGTMQWSAGGVSVSGKPGYAVAPISAADGNGGALVVWRNKVLQGDFDIFAQRVYTGGNLSSLSTPSNDTPADGTTVSTTPSLSASLFNDSALPSPASQSQAQWRVLDYADPTADRPKAAARMDSMYDGALSYRLPFTFPFYGRDITAIAVNKNGLIELLEEGESCVECTRPGTHANGAHIDAIDAIFTSNGNLAAEDGYVKVFNGGEQVMVEWYGACAADGGGMKLAAIRAAVAPPPASNPVHFQVSLSRDGRIEWNFRQMDFVTCDPDMYSGLYPRGGTEVDVGYAIATQSSYAFDPLTQGIGQVSYHWDAPADYIVYDSGESAIDTASHDVPPEAALAGAQTYYWSVRQQSDVGDWTPWSSPTRFTTLADDTTTASGGGGGALNPLLGLLFALPWLAGRRPK